MRKEFAHVSQSISIQSVSSRVSVLEYLLKGLHVDFIYLTETLSQQSIEFFVRPLFRTAICQTNTQTVTKAIRTKETLTCRETCDTIRFPVLVSVPSS